METARRDPTWQTDCTSDFLSAPTVDKYAVKGPDGELIAYGIKYYSATDKERFFVEEVARVTFEREHAKQNGISLSTLRPAFA